MTAATAVVIVATRLQGVQPPQQEPGGVLLPTQVHRRALQRALELTGGVEPLAAYLKVPANAVRFWVNGSSPLPGDVFLRIVDLVLDHSMMELRPPQSQTPGDTKNTPD